MRVAKRYSPHALRTVQNDGKYHDIAVSVDSFAVAIYIEGFFPVVLLPHHLSPPQQCLDRRGDHALGQQSLLVPDYGYGEDLKGIKNPVTVGLSVGDDSGTTAVNAVIK
jgi:hypothetical protein